MSSFPDEHDVQNPLIESQEEQFEAIQTNTPPTVCKEYPASHPEHIIWNQEVSEKEQTVQWAIQPLQLWQDPSEYWEDVQIEASNRDESGTAAQAAPGV